MAPPFHIGSLNETELSIRRHVRMALVTVTMMLFGVGGLAATTEITGAVIAPGELVVDTNVKKVQHPTGGIVGDLRVREGDHVEAGKVLIRLDDTQTRTNLQIVLKQLDEALARRARAEAERDGESHIVFPGDFVIRLDEADVLRVAEGEARLFELRRAARSGLKAQLREQIDQAIEQSKGLVEQVTAKGTEIEWITRELEGVRDLWKKKLVQFTRVTALERDSARLAGEKGQLVASIAQVKGRIAETELRILQIDEELRTEVGKELSELRSKIAELMERRVAAEDLLRRVDIRAPVTGVVHQLAVHTVGGVITAQGETIMQIVPDSEPFMVETRVAPQEIDQLRLGQRAVLRFMTANQRNTPELNGVVKLIAPNVSQDQKTGATFYTVRIVVPESESRRLPDLRMVPGMQVEAFIETNPRTILSYLVRPISDQLYRSFRER
ncbi:MAG: HlyD family type I secretion periplasmic adaptor subunit [Rhodoplanes sp.]|uniref:HlyD family type I secretion periplasmic adaptor subunit n=1 Tax=Rhodoplanes sp. TaxID=1968906 RepID=UPI0017CFAFEA|nr:HlyD family type I secretion periplasmic adaptor subunit [Rhodoplanes sp.]NVO17948.1 HlyD family type I secretion periplasmic adaptor subunit [Rhodoplanes sp.]